MNNGHHQFDVTHTLTTHFLFSNLNTATVTNDTLVTDTFVFSVVTLIIFNRSDNTLAEQTITFRFVGTIVNGFRFKNLTVAAFQDRIRRSKPDGNLRK